jgi:hypothetical protein
VAEREVRDILLEIRERVRSGATEKRAGANSLRTGDIISRAQQTGLDQQPASQVNASGAPAALERLKSHLAITARAQDQLPPLTTKREGLAARLELWLKRQARRSTHWYAWEQVNFNSAAHHALRDLAAALADYQQQLVSMHAQLSSLRELESETGSRFASFESRLAALEHRAAGSSETELRAEVAQLRQEFETKLSRLSLEQSGHIEQLEDEQRVSFKQLALEIHETAASAERAASILQSRLEELALHLEEQRVTR